MKRNRCGQFFCHVLVCAAVIGLIFTPGADADKGRGHRLQVKAMTRNLYLGADIFRVVEAAFMENENGDIEPNPDPYAIPMAVAEVFQTMQATDFPERAEAIADEIDRFKPHVIGLQEVSTYFIQTPGDFPIGNPVPATDLVIDFYATLDAALKRRGLAYQAFTVTNADIEMPMIDTSSTTGLSDVRLVDRDMILVRQDLWAKREFAGNYLFNLELNLGGIEVEFTRGYLGVEVKIDGQKFRFVNTHLEVQGEPESPFRVVQALQMNELLTLLEAEKRPTVMLGDFNSSPDDPIFTHAVYGPVVPPYRQAILGGYADAWLLQEAYDNGYTSGFDETLDDEFLELTTRIDLIFVDPKKLTIEAVEAEVVGDTIEEMTPNGLWPSDHAGVVAAIGFSHKK